MIGKTAALKQPLQVIPCYVVLALHKIPSGRGNWGVFFPIDNAWYSIAFGTHTKTTGSIEMPFGMMSELGPRNSVLCGVTIPEGEGQFWKNMYPTSLTPGREVGLDTADEV